MRITTSLPPRPAEVLGDGVLVARAEGIQATRRGGRVLAIEPESASWMVLDHRTWPVYAHLSRPLTFLALQAALPDRVPQDLTAEVLQLHRRGLVRLNGRPHLDPGGLWLHPDPEGPSFLALHVARGCNYACSYCYNSSAASPLEVMSPTVARRIVDKAFRELRATHLFFDFMGGEPLLAFETVLEVMRQARELQQVHQKEVSFLMQTNGALLTGDRVRRLVEFEVGVGVSLDGPPDLHDGHRRTRSGQDTHASVLANLLRARDMGLAVSPLAVIYEPASYPRVLDYFVEDLGFEAMRLNPCQPLGRARDHLDQGPERALALHRGFMEMVDRALGHARRLGRTLAVHDLDSMLRNLTSKRRTHMCLRSPCGLGNSILSFSHNGDVYACEEYEESTQGRLHIGSLDDLDLGSLAETSPRLEELWGRRVERIPRCSRCALRHICGGGCTHKALAWWGELLREDPLCRFYESTFTELMWKIWDEPELVPALGG